MRTRLPIVIALIVSFAAGVATTLAAKRVFEPGAYFAGKEPKAAAAALLATAEQLAGTGSWERIGVGRVHYLSGDKAKGQALFDLAISKKTAASDLYRIATVYALAKEWDKAKPLLERAIAMNPTDDTSMVEAAAWFNLNGERARAEELFGTAFAKNPDELWHYINAAGSYLGQPPF
jgi:tetratricopeptide (TPR) repeat protein